MHGPPRSGPRLRAAEHGRDGVALKGAQRALWGAFTERHAVFQIHPNRHEEHAKSLAGSRAIVTSDRWWAYNHPRGPARTSSGHARELRRRQRDGDRAGRGRFPMRHVSGDPAPAIHAMREARAGGVVSLPATVATAVGRPTGAGESRSLTLAADCRSTGPGRAPRRRQPVRHDDPSAADAAATLGLSVATRPARA